MKKKYTNLLFLLIGCMINNIHAVNAATSDKSCEDLLNAGSYNEYFECVEKRGLANLGWPMKAIAEKIKAMARLYNPEPTSFDYAMITNSVRDALLQYKNKTID